MKEQGKNIEPMRISSSQRHSIKVSHGFPVKDPECPCQKDAFPKYMPLQTMSEKVLEATPGGRGVGGGWEKEPFYPN